MIKHALKALAASLSTDMELDTKSVSISIVGKNQSFELIEGLQLQYYLDQIEVEGGIEVMDIETALETPEL